MQILGWIVFGLFAGIVAKLLMPGKDPGGFIITILLGIVGAVVGGYCAQFLGIAGGWWTSFALAVIGAMLLLGVYRLVKGKSAA